MVTNKEVMTLREASQYLGITPDTLYKRLNEDKIPAFKLGNRWRFKKDLLDRWMEADQPASQIVEKRNGKVGRRCWIVRYEPPVQLQRCGGSNGRWGWWHVRIANYSELQQDTEPVLDQRHLWAR